MKKHKLVEAFTSCSLQRSLYEGQSKLSKLSNNVISDNVCILQIFQILLDF